MARMWRTARPTNIIGGSLTRTAHQLTSGAPERKALHSQMQTQMLLPPTPTESFPARQPPSHHGPSAQLAGGARRLRHTLGFPMLQTRAQSPTVATVSRAATLAMSPTGPSTSTPNQQSRTPTAQAAAAAVAAAAAEAA
eukprot:954088-Alexandrium_andersonii.AAC.1